MGNDIKISSTPAMQGLAILENNKVMIPLVETGYIDEFGKRLNGYERGNVIPLLVPPNFTAELWDGSNATAQDVKEGVINLTVTDCVQIPISLPVADMTFLLECFNSGNGFTPEFIKRVINPIMQEIADFEDRYVLEKAAKATPYYYGAEGSTPDAVSDVTQIRKVLNKNKASLRNRALVLNPDADAKMLELDTFTEVDKSGTPLALQEAVLGRKYGFNCYMDQNVYEHTAGTLKAASDGSGTFSVKGAVAAGATSITIDAVKGGSATTLTGTLKEGDILTFTETTHGTAYAVVAELANATANEIAVTLKYPATAYYQNKMQEVSIADDSTLTLLGDHVANLAFAKDSIFHVSLPTAIAPDDGFILVNPYTGMGCTIRVEGTTIAGKGKKICAEMYIATAIRKEGVARLLG